MCWTMDQVGQEDKGGEGRVQLPVVLNEIALQRQAECANMELQRLMLLKT